MFNEYEEDPDEDDLLYVTPDVVASLVELLEEEESGTTSMVPSGARMMNEAEREIFSEIISNRRFEQDEIFYDLDYNASQTLDSEGFVDSEYFIKIKKLGGEVSEGKASLDRENFANNIGIYKDTISDSISTGGDIATGEYHVYSAVSRGGMQPNMNMVLDFIGGDGSSSSDDFFEDAGPDHAVDFGDSSTWGFRSRAKVSYSPSERTGFFLKYASILGTTTLTPDGITSAYLNNIFDAMSLDVYQTVITMEYVPKLIKQEDSSISKILQTSIGTESSPLSSATYDVSSQFEVEI